MQVVSDALSGELHVSRRATIAADIVSVREDGTKDVVRTFALNDMALTRGPLSDMVEFDITVSGHHIDRLRGDGVVVSTATGSTGYALSAGGHRRPRLHGHGLCAHRSAYHSGSRFLDLAERCRGDLYVR